MTGGGDSNSDQKLGGKDGSFEKTVKYIWKKERVRCSDRRKMLKIRLLGEGEGQEGVVHESLLDESDQRGIVPIFVKASGMAGKVNQPNEPDKKEVFLKNLCQFQNGKLYMHNRLTDCGGIL